MQDLHGMDGYSAGTYRPKSNNCDGDENFTAEFTAETNLPNTSVNSYTTDLSLFSNMQANEVNGTWRLYIQDFVAEDNGSLSRAKLRLYTGINCSCEDITNSKVKRPGTYYRNDIPDPESFYDFKCLNPIPIEVTDSRCLNVGQTLQCTNCTSYCDNCSESCDCGETWVGLGSELCFDKCVECCTYPELGCVASLTTFNNQAEVDSYFANPSIGDDRKQNCAESYGQMGPLTCYDGSTECGPAVEVTFTSSQADDYALAEYDGVILSGNNRTQIGAIGFSTSTTFYVVPGGTAKITYGNSNTSCGGLESASISAQGNTVNLSTPYKCGPCHDDPSVGPCPVQSYELTLLTLSISAPP